MDHERSAVALARMFADLARALHTHTEMDGALTQMVHTARTTVGCEHAGVVLRRPDGSIDTPAYTGELVRACDLAQIEAGEGPCLDALDHGPVLRVDDLEAEARWPVFARRAARSGVRSMLACRLAVQAGPRASLNLHATRPFAFDDEATALAEVFAAHASVALTGIRLRQTLEAALASRQTIGEATGLVMGRYRLTARRAFAVLVRASQHRNVKLRDLADEIVRDGPHTLRPRTSRGECAPEPAEGNGAATPGRDFAAG